jgi:hypothetical protein
MIGKYQADIQALEQELAVVDTSGLQVVLDGQGVYQHTISADRLTSFLKDLQRSLRHVAANDVRTSGDTFTDNEKAMTDVHIASLFDGSVGLNLTAPPGPLVGEQIDMLRPTLFDRAVDKVIDVLSTARELEDMEGALLNLAAGLSKPAINALTDLARSISEAGAPTRFAWHGTSTAASRFLTLVPSQAAELVEILESVQPVEKSINVYGTLASVDSHDGSFHLVGEEVEYRGVVADGHLHEAQAKVYTNVSAELMEKTVEGRFAKRSRPKYTLLGFIG